MDAPERLVIERLRPLWQPALGCGPNGWVPDFNALRRALRALGPEGRAAWEQVAAAQGRYAVTKATLRAAATTRLVASASIPLPAPAPVPAGTDSCSKAGYTTIDAAKSDMRLITDFVDEVPAVQKRLLSAVDGWWPSYVWARDVGVEHNASDDVGVERSASGDSTGRKDLALAASLTA